MALRNLDGLAIFVEVVESRSFSAAAMKLQLSAALVSRRVRELEEEMGVHLINRSTRHLILTEAGEGFYRECARAIRAIDSARTMAVGLSDEPKGTLRVHAGIGIGQGLIAQAVANLKVKYPDISVDLDVSTERVNTLGRRYDVLIKTANLPEAGLDCREFGEVQRLIVASEDFLHRAGEPREPADLANFECLLLYGRRPPNEWQFIGPNGHYMVRVGGTFRSRSAVAVYIAAVNGLGIARIPEYVVQDRVDSRSLRVLFTDCVAPERALKAYFPRSPHTPAKVRAFLECLELADLETKRHLREFTGAELR